MKEKLRPLRVFSEPLKRKIVRDIESGKFSVAAVSRQYEVSHTSLYNWVNKYSRNLQSGQKIVMQMDSESYKTKELEKRIMELEAALGRKQLEVDFLNQMVEQGKKELGIDLKKKFFTPPSNGSGSTKGSTGTK
jgi:transposase